MKNKVLVAMGIGIFAALTFNAASVTTLADDGQQPDPQKSNENNQYNFDKEMKTRIEGTINVPHTKTKVYVGIENIKNYVSYRNKITDIVKSEETQQSLFGANEPLSEESLPFLE